jgi:hypothetical protein
MMIAYLIFKLFWISGAISLIELLTNERNGGFFFPVRHSFTIFSDNHSENHPYSIFRPCGLDEAHSKHRQHISDPSQSACNIP